MDIKNINLHLSKDNDKWSTGAYYLGHKNILLNSEKETIGYYFIDTARDNFHMLVNPSDILEFIKSEYWTESLNYNPIDFQTKYLATTLNYLFNIPKYKIVAMVQELKASDLIKRISLSGNCKTTCASCYEHGCDALPSAPYNCWTVVSKKTSNK
jgi:hypothetical protein